MGNTGAPCPVSLLAGKITGAERHGRIWLIPKRREAEDSRVKSGRYVKGNAGGQAVKDEIAAAAEAPVIRTKTRAYSSFIPIVPESIVPRPRLIEKIAPPASSLTYIHAGAGYGKTTLLVQYAGGRDGVVWLTLDEGD